MKRTKLCDRVMPGYTRGEEIANMVTHILGGAIGLAVLALSVWKTMHTGDAWDVVGAWIYGLSMIGLYAVSSVYHGLAANMGKRVMQVVDHCTIYLLIGGTYTPILFSAIRPNFPGWAWTIFGLVWGIAMLAAVFTAIDLRKYAALSMACYIATGWCIIVALKPMLASLPMPGICWLVAGGVAYTAGAVLYGMGKKHRYMHTVFHVFVVAGSVLQFVSVYFWCF